eukprot:scaffold34645_cov201-Amphora_coffeaeformis.AAC.4
MKVSPSRSTQRKALLFASIAAVLVLGGESFVNAKLLDRSGKTMCFSKEDKKDVEPQLSNTQEVKRLTWNPLRLAVLRLGFTEWPATSRFNYGKYNGEFTCAYCGNLLFDSSAKYDSGSGWPSFWRSATDTSLAYKMEFDGRLECRCQKCKSHLGHVFLDGPTPSSVEPPLLAESPAMDPRSKTGRYLPRFCINGTAMTFRDSEE